MLIIFQVKVFWVVMPCSVTVGYQWLEEPSCLHLKGEVKGPGKGGINIGTEYKRGKSPETNRN
jgi:hypothetical protein